MNKALVAGALGVSGRALVNHLVSFPGLGGRRAIAAVTGVRIARTLCAIDLLNQSDVDASSATRRRHPHLLRRTCSRAATSSTKSPPNLAMLRHVVEAVERTSARCEKSS